MDFIWIMSFQDGKTKTKAFKSEKKARDFIYVKHPTKNYPKQVRHGKWEFGQRDGTKIVLEQIEIMDRKDLFV